MYCWLLLQIYLCYLWLLLCSRDTYTYYLWFLCHLKITEDNLPHKVSFTMLFAMRHRIGLKSNFTPPPPTTSWNRIWLQTYTCTLSCGSANDVTYTLSWPHLQSFSFFNLLFLNSIAQHFEVRLKMVPFFIFTFFQKIKKQELCLIFRFYVQV